MENRENQSEAPKKGGKRRFNPGISYSNPYREPGKAPKGYFWVTVERSEGNRGYPTRWMLQSTNPEPPSIDELPPVEGLLTKKEFDNTMAAKMRDSFEKYENPSKGSQPSSDFEPDE